MSEKRRGLGRGLGALIPSSASAGASGNGVPASRPVDLFFPEARKAPETVETPQALETEVAKSSPHEDLRQRVRRRQRLRRRRLPRRSSYPRRYPPGQSRRQRQRVPLPPETPGPTSFLWMGRRLNWSRFQVRVSPKFLSVTSTPTANSRAVSSMRTTWPSWFIPSRKSASYSQLWYVLQPKRVENRMNW